RASQTECAGCVVEAYRTGRSSGEASNVNGAPLRNSRGGAASSPTDSTAPVMPRNPAATLAANASQASRIHSRRGPAAPGCGGAWPLGGAPYPGGGGYGGAGGAPGGTPWPGPGAGPCGGAGAGPGGGPGGAGCGPGPETGPGGGPPGPCGPGTCPSGRGSFDWLIIRV